MKNGSAESDGIQPGLDHRSTYRFSRIAALHSRAFSKVYSRKFMLTVSTWKILTVIGRFEPLSANAAGAHSSLEPDKVTRAVDALVKQGYVLRRQDSKDRRKVVLSLSSKGQHVHDELNRLRDMIEHEFLRVLSASEIASLYSILDKLEAKAVKLFSDKRTLNEIVDGAADNPRQKRSARRRIPFPILSAEQRS
jgi:DNA-binding MarR family transcriptional regulator